MSSWSRSPLRLPLYQFCLLGALLIACIGIALRFDVDFTVFHGAVQILRGGSYEVYGVPVGMLKARFFYGPLFLVLLSPLARFSFFAAKLIWIALQTAA